MPDGTTPHGNAKASREDWLRAAMEILVTDGVTQVKIQRIGQKLNVSRSSFYWYFQSRTDLLNQLLEDWERSNTGIMLAHADLPADSISQAVLNFFRCVVAPEGFNHRLDFAVREWARRDAKVRRVIDRSDQARHAALARMFQRHGFAEAEADIRARVLYYQQIGYYALELNEDLETRLSRVAGYVQAFTGQPAREQDLQAFCDHARAVSGSDQ